MRGRVLAGVRARLRAAGVRLDGADLDACYAQAWHGLYMTMLKGRVVTNPQGWLTLVTYRRAIDEFRVGHRRDTDGELEIEAPERDLAGELDDRVRLRQLMEGLRARLSPRERQAAALCYLQGLSRAQAAAQMGVSEKRMRKLMDGSGGPGSSGVAGKVGELLQSISAGAYCAEQSSLMRGFAFGVLDPDGERYALALAHQRECPACRAHVLSLRGLAAVLPPLPLPLLLGAGVVAGSGATAGGVGAGAGTGASASAGTGATSAGTAAGGVGAAGVSGAAGVGAGAGVGGGWLMAGGLGAKLAVGCLIAVGVGAGCVALSVSPIPLPSRASGHRQRRGRPAEHMVVAYEQLSPSVGAQLSSTVATASPSPTHVSVVHADADGASRTSKPRPAEMAQREFGIEHSTGQASLQSSGSGGSSVGGSSATAQTASAAREFAGAAAATGSEDEAQSGTAQAHDVTSASGAVQSHATSASAETEHSDPSAAAREFGLR